MASRSGARRRCRSDPPPMPIAIEQLDVTRYDLVISMNSAVAKGVVTGPDQVRIRYVFGPIRYARDLREAHAHESGADRA